MMSTHHNGYVPSWSNRREIAGLLGTFSIFVLTCSGHSDTLVNQTRQILVELVRVTLVFLGLITPVTHSGPVHTHHRILRSHHLMVQPFIGPMMPVITESTLAPVVSGVPMNAFQKHWTYIFEGKATLHDQPCPNSSVLVRLSNGDQSVAQGTITGPDGSYILRVAIDANDGDPVDWTLESFTPDFQKVELNGRKIVQSESSQDSQVEQKPILVTAPIEFQLSLNQ
jgi:hypothetical protein